MNDIADLTVKIDSSNAELAARVLDMFTKSAAGSASSADLLMTAAKRLMVVLGPTAVVGAFAVAIKHAIELQESYVRLSEIAGTTASTMSALDLPARLAGVSLDSVATSIARLGRAIGDARLGDNDKKNLFKALGIDINDGRDAAQIFVDVGKAAMGMRDQTIASTVSMTLLGRGFAEMRPVMKEIIEQGGLHKRVTDEEAAAAKHFQDQLTTLNYEIGQGKVALANDLLPSINAVATAMVRAQKEGGLLQAVIAGVQTVITGTDQYKNDKEFVELVDQKLQAMNAISRLSQKGSVQVGGDTLDYWQRQLVQINAKLETTLTYRRQLENPKAATAPILPSYVGDLPLAGQGAGGPSTAEQNVKKLMDDKKHYEERINAAKGFSERYAQAIATGNELAKEANKQGLLNDDDLLRQLRDNERAKLTVQIQSLAQQKALHEQQGDLAKREETVQAIAAANAAIVANDAITTARLTSNAVMRVREYQKWQEATVQGGEEIANSYLDTAEAENRSYETRKITLEVFLADQGEAIQNAQYLREAMEVQHQQNLLDIERNKHQAERGMQIGTAQLAEELLQQFAGRSKVAAIAVIAINKALAIAQVIQATAVATMRAFSDLGPIAGIPAAAAIQSLGAVQMGLIVATGLIQASQATGGGGAGVSAPSVGGGGGIVTPATTPVPVAQQQGPTTVIHLHGDTYSRDQLRELVDQLNENSRDGGRLVVA